MPFGIAYLIFLIGLGLIGTTQPVEAKLHSIAPLVPLFLTMLGAGLGLVSLWLLLLFGREQICARPKGRMAVLVCQFTGIAAAVYWFAVLGAPTRGVPLRAWTLWTVLLSGPVLVSLKYLYRLLWQPAQDIAKTVG